MTLLLDGGKAYKLVGSHHPVAHSTPSIAEVLASKAYVVTTALFHTVPLNSRQSALFDFWFMSWV